MQEIVMREYLNHNISKSHLQQLSTGTHEKLKKNLQQ